MKKLSWLGAIVLPFCLVTQAGIADDKPEWLDGQSRRFVPEFYLLGVGQASTVSQANDAARAELAKTIRVSINSQLSSRQTVVAEKKGSGPTNEQISSEATQRVTSTTRVDLQGIEIAENWMDPATKQHYSLAVLDRKKAEMALDKDLSALDQEVMQLVEQSKKGDDGLAQIGYLLKSKDRLAQFDELNTYLRVVSLTNKSRTASIPALEIDQAMKNLQQNLIISVQAEGANTDEVAQAAKGALAAFGFKTGSNEAASLILTLKLKLEKPMKKDQWIWARGTVSVSLVDKASGSQRGSYDWNLKNSATDDSLASQRLMMKVHDTLSEELGATVLGFAETK